MNVNGLTIIVGGHRVFVRRKGVARLERHASKFLEKFDAAGRQDVLAGANGIVDRALTGELPRDEPTSTVLYSVAIVLNHEPRVRDAVRGPVMDELKRTGEATLAVSVDADGDRRWELVRRSAAPEGSGPSAGGSTGGLQQPRFSTKFRIA